MTLSYLFLSDKKGFHRWAESHLAFCWNNSTFHRESVVVRRGLGQNLWKAFYPLERNSAVQPVYTREKCSEGCGAEKGTGYCWITQYCSDKLCSGWRFFHSVSTHTMCSLLVLGCQLGKAKPSLGRTCQSSWQSMWEYTSSCRLSCTILKHAQPVVRPQRGGIDLAWTTDTRCHRKVHYWMAPFQQHMVMVLSRFTSKSFTSWIASSGSHIMTLWWLEMPSY